MIRSTGFIDCHRLMGAGGWINFDSWVRNLLKLWPTPTATGLQGAIYYPEQINRFNTVDDTIALPPGYNRFMRDNLAVELFPEFREGQQMDQMLMMSAVESKANIKRINYRLSDMSCDPELLWGRSAYSIYTGP